MLADIQSFEDTFNPHYRGALDVPDEKDFIASHIFGDLSVDVPSELNLKDHIDHVHNQGRTMHCTSYGLTHCIEIMNSIEHSFSCLADPEQQWRSQCNLRGVPSTIGGGDSLQNALNAYIKFGLENKKDRPELERFWGTGYAKIENTIADMKKWIALGFPIYTGSGSHCYAIVGYSDKDEKFIALNSYGTKSGPRKDGTFDVRYSDFGKLFTKYIIYDKEDVEKIYRDVSKKSQYSEAIEWCLEKGFMKGYNHEGEPDPKKRFFKPEQPLTRAEFAQVLYNLRNKLS